MTTDDTEQKDLPKAESDQAGELLEELESVRLERDRLKLALVQREALLMAAARKLRRFVPHDPVVTAIARTLGNEDS